LSVDEEDEEKLSKTRKLRQNRNRMTLTVEVESDHDREAPAEVAICFDDEGLDLLLRKLERLRGKKDHLHLMTPSWSGEDLTEEKQGGSNYELINHLRLVKV
jgi:hypothetical protein